MTAADGHPGSVGRYEGGGDAVFVLVADQVIGIVELEREPQHRGDGRQRDVALVPVEADADDGLAFPLAFANDAVVDDRGRIGASLR